MGQNPPDLTLADGTHAEVAVSDLLLEGSLSEPPPALLPEGRLDLPFALQPWPAEIDAKPGDSFPVVLYPEERKLRRAAFDLDGDFPFAPAL